MNFFVLDDAPSIADADYKTLKARLLPYYDTFGIAEFPENPAGPGPGFDDELLELLLQARPAVVSFHFGTPGKTAIEALKAAGIRLISSATNVTEAVALEATGMDAIIAQGWEAGGHRGSHVANGPGDGIGLMALVPQVIDAVDLPVIAAGGIADGRGIAAALALGASAVQIGTAFLNCPEASVSERHREVIAASRAHDTMFTNAVSGRCARGLASDYAIEMAGVTGPFPSFPTMYALSDPIRTAAADMRPEPISFHLFGQSAALTRSEPARDIVDRLVSETQKVLADLSGAGRS